MNKNHQQTQANTISPIEDVNVSRTYIVQSEALATLKSHDREILHTDHIVPRQNRHRQDSTDPGGLHNRMINREQSVADYREPNSRLRNEDAEINSDYARASYARTAEPSDP